jgi:hypothetical protein
MHETPEGGPMRGGGLRGLSSEFLQDDPTDVVSHLYFTFVGYFESDHFLVVRDVSSDTTKSLMEKILERGLYDADSFVCGMNDGLDIGCNAYVADAI